MERLRAREPLYSQTVLTTMDNSTTIKLGAQMDIIIRINLSIVEVF
jgi:hypothetical protein